MTPHLSPFKFLDSYTKDDRAIFFGRDHETEELYQKVFESKILLVYGVSGTGKSSLIHCGLAGKFSDSDWLPINIRRGGNIVESLHIAIEKATIGSPQSATGSQQKEDNKTIADCRLPIANLKKSLRNLYLDHFKPIYLIFDQFEELFIFGSKSEKEEFIKSVKAIVESDLQCRFLFVIREEYLAGITEFEKQIATILLNRVRIEKMTRINAQQAIEGPCKFAGIEVEPGFSDQLLEKLSPEGGDVELTYLQVFLDKIFKLAVSENPDQLPKFNLAQLQKTGDVKDLLGSFLEEQIAQLPEPDTALVVLKAFVSTKGTKRQVTEDEVLDYSRTLGKNITLEMLRELIQRFVALRILRDKDDSDRYELRHDALAAKIFEKITVFEKDLLEIRQFIENAFANYEKRRMLLSVADLKYISQYEDKIFLGGALLDFVNKSKKDIKSKRKVLNWITALSVAVMFVVLGLFVLYFVKQSDLAKSKDAAITSIFAISDPVEGFVTAERIHADRKANITIAAEFRWFFQIAENTRKVTGKNPLDSLFDFQPISATILFAAFSEDGKEIVGYSSDSAIYVWDISGKLKSKIISPEVPVLLKMSSDNNFLGAVLPSGKAIVWNPEGDSLCVFNVTWDHHNACDIISFATKRKQVCAISGKKINIYDLASGKMIQQIEGHLEEVTSVCVSPDERFIASASKDNTVRVWYFNRKTKLYAEYSVINGHVATVWSALFNDRSDYILTASADSSAIIFNLKGQPQRISFNDYIYRALSSWTPVSRADFTGDGSAMKLSRYWDYPGEKKDTTLYWKNLSFALNYYFQSLAEDTSIIDCDVAPLGYYQAVVYRGNNFTTFNSTMETNMFRIFEFPGTQPRFSQDGNYLLTISKNRLNLLPSNEKEMHKLIFEKKIFGAYKEQDYVKTAK